MKRRLGRLIFPALLGLAVYFAVFGGEYSLLDLHRAGEARAAEARELEELRREIDSLRAWADSLENDAGTLERLARERFGLIRFGSRVDVYLPEGARILVAPGQRAVAGETVIAAFDDPRADRDGEVR